MKTKPRTPNGFAATAKRAVEDGFRAVKGAPFDGFPKPGSAAAEIRSAVDQGIACVAAMRAAIGPDVELMVDCHSFFDVPLAQSVARRLEQYNLAWYEEPVAPATDGGRGASLGTKEFAPLCRRQAVNVIMPDVKHCGGLLEMTRIAAMAQADGVSVAPHNPSGPVSTAASVQICAGMGRGRLACGTGCSRTPGLRNSIERQACRVTSGLTVIRPHESGASWRTALLRAAFTLV